MYKMQPRSRTEVRYTDRICLNRTFGFRMILFIPYSQRMPSVVSVCFTLIFFYFKGIIGSQVGEKKTNNNKPRTVQRDPMYCSSSFPQG